MTRGILALCMGLLMALSSICMPLGRAFAAAPTSSQQPFKITTSPSTVLLATTPGKSVSTDLRIANDGTQTEHMQISLLKFNAVGEQGRPNLFERSAGDDYFDWVHFSQSKFDAPPGQWITIKMTVDVPKTGALGYYYAIAFKRAQATTKQDKQSSTSLVGAAATLVLLNVQVPNEHRQLNMTDFSTDHHIYQYLPVSFNMRLRNTGNIHVSPVGNIFIKRGGKSVATLDVNKAGGNILPGSARVFSANWRDGFPMYTDKQGSDGKPLLTSAGLPKRSLSWNFGHADKFRFGKYTAEAMLIYNDGKHDVPVQQTLTFWVIPWGMIAILVLILLLIVAGFWTLSRGMWRRTKHTGRYRQR